MPGLLRTGSSVSILCCSAARTVEESASSARVGHVKRETKETKVGVKIGIDGTGRCRTRTPIHFLNHMLDVSFLEHLACVRSA